MKLVLLAYLYYIASALYQFDILNDIVFDAMHILLLRVVKRHLDYFKKGDIDQTVEDRLNAMPWTAGE